MPLASRREAIRRSKARSKVYENRDGTDFEACQVTHAWQGGPARELRYVQLGETDHLFLNGVLDQLRFIVNIQFPHQS